MNFLQLFQSESPSPVLGGRYKVLKQLGAGGFGQTFLAADLHLPGHPHCVVKRLQPQFHNPEALQTAKRLFDTEAQTLYALGNHDQIPKLLAHFEQEQEFYLAQELIVGHALSHEVRNGQPWSEAQVVGLMRDILEVLAFVHQQNVIHRDIKPDNLIRRDADGKIVLIDFGAVKQATTQLLSSEGQSRLTVSIGTPGYMPSEQIAGSPRFSSDVFAVGMIGIHALTGISPRSLPVNPQTSEIAWQEKVTAVHPALAAVLNQMVCYDFRTRYSTATEALAAIVQLPILPEPPPRQTPFPAPSANPSANTPVSLSPVQTTAPFPDNVARSGNPQEIAAPFISTAAATPLSQKGTVAVRPIALSARTAPIQQFLRRPPKPVGLAVGGIAALVLLVALIKPLLSPRPATNLTAENTSSPAPFPSPSSSPDAKTQAAALLAQADQLREQNQFQQAVQAYDQTIALDPNLPEAHWGRCYSLNILEQFASAVSACDRALKLNPKYAEALWSKGYALDRQDQDQAALMLYEQAIAQKPNFAKAWSNKGTALMQLNRPAEAVAAFDQAIKLDPNLAEAWNNRGVALWSARRFEEALSSVERAIQIQPHYADALNLRQQMRQKLGR